MEVKDIIKNRRVEMGLTMKELADKVGVSEGTVSRWESGHIANMRRDRIAALSRILEIPAEVIMGWETDVDRFSNFAQDFNARHPELLAPAMTKKYPVLTKIACGQPIIPNDEDEQVVMSDGNAVKADAVVIARGNSMTGARIYDGDIVFVRLQDQVENGEIAVVVVENDMTTDNEITLKRFYLYGDRIVLRSENRDYADMEFINEDMNRVKVVGKAVAFQSELK